MKNESFSKVKFYKPQPAQMNSAGDGEQKRESFSNLIFVNRFNAGGFSDILNLLTS